MLRDIVETVVCDLKGHHSRPAAAISTAFTLASDASAAWFEETERYSALNATPARSTTPSASRRAIRSAARSGAILSIACSRIASCDSSVKPDRKLGLKRTAVGDAFHDERLRLAPQRADVFADLLSARPLARLTSGASRCFVRFSTLSTVRARGSETNSGSRSNSPTTAVDEVAPLCGH